MVIRVVGEGDCTSADVESDPWIALKVSWWPRGQIQPLYLRVTGAQGGEVELKVHPETGALLEAIVIIEPPKASKSPVEVRVASNDVRVDKTPKFDRTLWGVRDGHSGPRGPQVAHMAIEALAFARESDAAVLRFSTEPVVRRLRCGNAAVGISATGTLATIEGLFSE